MNTSGLDGNPRLDRGFAVPGGEHTVIPEMVRHYLSSTRVPLVMRQLEQLCSFDRYQASTGIMAAAEFVASAARDAGLAGVSVDHHPAGGKRRWWSFDAPASWSPIRARIEITGKHGVRVIDHANTPFSIATNSREHATAGGPASVVTFDNIAGSTSAGGVCLIPGSSFSSHTLAELTKRGFAGFISDDGATGIGTNGTPGRIELPADTQLFGFAVSTDVFNQLEVDCAAGPAFATIEVVIDRFATMPVVSGYIPGTADSDEIWLTAHLCHPRPGANDNGSGVAALLEIARLLSRDRYRAAGEFRRKVRFVMAPEFTGMAAFLHSRSHLTADERWPLAVLNLDMVGENQPLCGGPFVVERPPTTQASLLTPLVETVVETVFAEAFEPNYSWISVPFTGFSDHALFSRRGHGAPAIQFCHTVDRYNHSGADTIDKVSPTEMRRAIVAGAVSAQLLSADDEVLFSTLDQSLSRWCEKEARAVETAVGSQHVAHTPSSWAVKRLETMAAEQKEMFELVAKRTFVSSGSHTTARQDARSVGSVGALTPTYSGPPNVRALLGDLSSEQRQAFARLVREDKSALSLILRLLVQAEGQAIKDVLSTHDLDSCAPIDPKLSHELLSLIVASGWLLESEHLPITF